MVPNDKGRHMNANELQAALRFSILHVFKREIYDFETEEQDGRIDLTFHIKGSNSISIQVCPIEPTNKVELTISEGIYVPPIGLIQPPDTDWIVLDFVDRMLPDLNDILDHFHMAMSKMLRKEAQEAQADREFHEALSAAWE